MTILDFIYDGVALSSLGYIICDFDGGQAVRNIENSTRTFSNVSIFNGKFMPFTTSIYSDRLEFTFDIMKEYCTGKREDDIISIPEAQYLMRWLARPEAHKLKFVCSEYANIFFEGSFNVQDLRIGDDIFGLRCTFITNRPFGLHEDVLYNKTFESIDDTLDIVDISDEEGYTYPYIEIYCNESGNLQLVNSYDKRSTIINNCSEGEKIIITENLVLGTDRPTHKIQNDFNYEFLRISNNYYNRTNIITSTLKCNLKISYNPVAKVVI